MENQDSDNKYCGNCGAPVSGGRYCTNCGAQVSGPFAGTMSAVSTPAPPVSTSGDPTTIREKARMEARLSNYLAIPGFLGFAGGLVLYIIGASRTSAKALFIVPAAMMLIGGGALLGVALVYSIMHWSDLSKASREERWRYGYVGPPAVPCPSCGRWNPPGSAFCNVCGANFYGRR
jgi:hypothetical protein